MQNCKRLQKFSEDFYMISRTLEEKLRYFAKKLPVVAVLGPRQSGKTTLTKASFPHYRYITFEDAGIRLLAEEDPKKFLQDLSQENGVIFDEIQRVPSLFSYMQLWVDEHDRPGYFVLTGSHNFLLSQIINQTLAGRIAILTLLPLSIYELKQAQLLPKNIDTLIVQGQYPRIYAKNLIASDLYPFYIQTYVERDVRQIINVTNLHAFQTFIKLCAGRIGQLLNLSSLSNDCGISVNTAKSWLSVLEASYIIFLLQPYHKNFNKRLIKSPKLYFYDTGIACSLLGIQNAEQLATHYLRGGLFENLIMSDIIKTYYNQGLQPQAYFWRDSQGHEIDCLLEKTASLIPIEIKAGQTINPSFFTGIDFFKTISDMPLADEIVIYGGEPLTSRGQGRIVSWQDMSIRLQSLLD
jgi:predicted AAA+ superfamily ATPase